MVQLNTWAQSISPTLGYVIENTFFSSLAEGESPGVLHAGQATPTTRYSTMWFLCTLTTQLVDLPCTTFSSAVGSEIHH
jgi:hypothetical protein